MNLKLFLKTQLFTLLFLGGLGLVTVLIILGIFYLRFRQFAAISGLGVGELVQIGREGWERPVKQTAGHVNILILGLDTLEGRGDVPALTDTMMLLSLNLKNGEIRTLSLPRDLWHEAYQTRINALYHYGKERSPASPETFPTQVLAELTGVEFHHTVVLSLSQVSTVIDLLGGIEVDVPTGFVDETFPRPGVDVQVVRDPALLYQRIEFQAGKQMLNGERALQYIRSRKSGDDEGTDVARGGRQQLVIDGLLARLRQKDTLTSPQTMGKLTKFYLDNFAKVLPPEELVGLGRALWPVRNNLQITNHNLTISPADGDGVIFHPEPRLYRGEWVYALVEPTKFTNFVRTSLGL